MASNSPISPARNDKRRSILDQFPNLDIGSSTSTNVAEKMEKEAPGMTGSFTHGWPPSSLSSRGKASLREVSSSADLPFTLRMSQDYRIYDDRWRLDKAVKDEPVDVSAEFEASQGIMTEIAGMLNSQQILPKNMEKIITEEMAKVVFGSNKIERLGLGLDETFRLCLAVFEGDEELGTAERSKEYQEKLDAFVIKNSNPGEKAVIRSRREVVQHAAAFQYLINVFVKRDEPLSEALIRDTHAILVMGLSAEDAGVFSNRNFGGTYRHHEAYAGALRYTKASDIPKAMRSLARSLQADLEAIESSGTIDPFMLAAKYCDRFVNVHPFRDGNGRMCRLILNAILIKYAGIVVVLGEKDQDRDEYLQIAQESTRVGSHPGQLGKMVLERAAGTLRKMKARLRTKDR